MALSEAQINGRFRFLERPAVAPGKCACCGAVDKPVIDFGFDLDFYGVVYLCLDCLGEAVQVAGANLADGAKSQVVPLPPISTEALDEYFRAVTNSLNRVTAIIPDSYLLPDEGWDSTPTDDAGEADGEPTESIQDAQGNDDAEPESTSVERSDDLPVLSGGLSL